MTEIAIVGVVISLIVEGLKRYFKTEEWKTLAVLAAVCLVSAAGYTYLREAGYLETVMGVLVTASAFWALVITRFK